MRRTSFAQWPCSIARTMDLLGDWWTPLVLREAFYGIRRFDAFQESLGIARNTLTDRLRRLVEEGLLEKRPYQTEPVRHDYVLTEKGRDFYGVLLVMNRWGGPLALRRSGPAGDDAPRGVRAGDACRGGVRRLRRAHDPGQHPPPDGPRLPTAPGRTAGCAGPVRGLTGQRPARQVTLDKWVYLRNFTGQTLIRALLATEGLRVHGVDGRTLCGQTDG
ncbi:winged helix-turn-helix transcriptional regulator [Streptomyces sp. NPDC020794]|uniref:winged helix-turn-helix transcriptional regulator n=1 Tax=unclassified Streptomyces TaxID=2593676 RepID=UPI0036E0B6FB